MNVIDYWLLVYYHIYIKHRVQCTVFTLPSIFRLHTSNMHSTLRNIFFFFQRILSEFKELNAPIQKYSKIVDKVYNRFLTSKIVDKVYNRFLTKFIRQTYGNVYYFFSGIGFYRKPAKDMSTRSIQGLPPSTLFIAHLFVCLVCVMESSKLS